MKTVIETRKRTVTKKVTNELNGIRELLSKFPTGIFSMVSDTFDLWRMCTEYLPALKEEILSRDGKLVIRPDSGDPVDIICGTGYKYKKHSEGGEEYSVEEQKGVIELLWDVFGGTVNEQGYKVLDSHIGAIYGDSITIDRAEQICSRLEAKGFASTNIVLGVGSFTYQFNTRDTFGFAMKATYVELEVPKFGEFVDQNLNTEIIGRQIFKDPITDDGTKKSATGLLNVDWLVGSHGKGIILKDKVSWEEEGKGLLNTIYKDGVFQNQTTLTQIRERLKK
jgi:nicotinamide phosphoribosyltransferase